MQGKIKRRLHVGSRQSPPLVYHDAVLLFRVTGSGEIPRRWTEFISGEGPPPEKKGDAGQATTTLRSQHNPLHLGAPRPERHPRDKPRRTGRFVTHKEGAAHPPGSAHISSLKGFKRRGAVSPQPLPHFPAIRTPKLLGTPHSAALHMQL